jgi:plasmid stabilization system protein ParE
MAKRVTLSPLAEADLVEIAFYISEGSLQASD